MVKSQSGNCDGLVNAMHITASVFINDDESGLHYDYEKWLERIAPHEPVDQYHHNDTGEDNADAHMKRQIMGREVVIAVTDGKLDFGPWEQIFYGEFDGRRRKRVLIKIIGELKISLAYARETMFNILSVFYFASIYAWEFGFDRSKMRFGEISKW